MCAYIGNTILALRDNDEGTPTPYVLNNGLWDQLLPEALHAS